MAVGSSFKSVLTGIFLSVAMLLPVGTALANSRAERRAPALSIEVSSNLAKQANSSPNLNGRCDVRIDISASMDTKPRKVAIDSFEGVLDQIVDRFNCRTLGVSAFTSSAFPIKMAQFDFPATESGGKCDDGVPDKPIYHTYPDLRERDKKTKKAECEDNLVKQHEKAQSRRHTALLPAHRFVLSLDNAVGPGKCTAIYQNASYGLTHAQYVIIVTDANSNCPWPRGSDGKPLGVQVQSPAKLIFLLIKGTDDPTGELTLAREQEAKLVFSNSVAVPLEEAVAPSFWQQMP
jgi:hypothetical protein